MAARFTIDGSDALERQLARVCEQVLDGVCGIVPRTRLEALVLGGGYGRGEGGVLRAGTEDQPYNDLEFYVFIRGNRLLSRRRFTAPLHDLGEELSRKWPGDVNAPGVNGTSQPTVHVEFKVEQFDRFRRQPVSMFSYDLVAGHKIIYGRETVFAECQHHLDARRIPLLEATRLLFNRCSGLLLAAELLRRSSLDVDQADFVARNTAKARLALGDAILAAHGQYHWSCLERRRRLLRLECEVEAGTGTEFLPFPLDEIRRHHAAGVEFKLHPVRSPQITSEIKSCHSEVLELSRKVWLWLESKRLSRQFASIYDYAACPVRKFSETALWRNLLLNLRSFGIRGALDSMAFRYPRERLFNCLPLLLWNGFHDTADSASSDATLRLQRQLHTRASDWSELVSAYKAVWPMYG